MGVTYNSTIDYYSTKMITSGLVLHLDAANQRSYPGTGSIWYDLTGNNRNAIKQGTRSPNYPCFNSRGYFNFIGGVVAENYSRFNASGIPAMDQLTAMVWFKTTNSTTAKTLIRMTNSDFELSLNSTTLFYAAGTSFNDIGVGKNIASSVDGKWHQTAVTYNGFSISGYLDGRYEISAIRAASALASTQAGFLQIGTRDDAYNQHHVGDIAQVLVYNRCLSADEVKYMYDLFYRRYLY